MPDASTIANDQQNGVPVTRAAYGMDETAIRNTLVKIAQYIREGSRTPSIQKIAASAVDRVYPRSVRTTNRQVAQTLLDYVREHVRYRPDPKMVEMVKSPKITLCADDAPICIPVEDCDGLVSALGALIGSMGVDVHVLVQDYGPDSAEQHVLILFQDDDGSWLTADPSSSSKPIGAKDSAVTEYTVDPLNPQEIKMPAAPQAEFITVGAPKTVGKPCCAACAEGKPCTGCGSKVHPCPCETGQTLGRRPMIGAAAVTGSQGAMLTATAALGAAMPGALVGLLVGALAHKNLGKSALVGASIGGVIGAALTVLSVQSANAAPTG